MTTFKQLIQIVIQIAVLFGFSFVGGWLGQTLNLPIPGSIIGLILLFIGLLTKVVPVPFVEKGATTLLHYLTLLFVPATVGIMNYLDIFTGKRLLLVAVVIISTLCTMAASGLTAQVLGKKVTEAERQEESV
ncbi:murein hydrolase LrgA [Pontibacillus halophilus JSM 076056 = DSM 19796]|uniref:Murein hydrolase LrgA n=1 Tax=Pontibacillus halophilus JSM 076056 = DSM 19796 TaxID=1385510 RepID=A0A0A5GIX8_9BACI|nr:CidA/LrgA family holin-like protein [Pontibacillus halophilus]KGX91095.1 murein hydrolase LrgA [Pontibacillus halophilus JSM 076056 = DSM 19796]